MVLKYRNKELFYIFIATILALYNFLFFDKYFFGILLVILQSVILFNMLIFKGIYKFFIYYVIFTISSVEYSFDPSYTGVLYNFRNLNIFDVNVSLIFALVGTIYLLLKGYLPNYTTKKNGNYYLWIFNLTLLLLGLFIGILNFFYDKIFVKYYIIDSYYGIFLMCILYMTNYVINTDKYAIDNLKSMCLGLVIGSVISSFISIPLGLSAFYGGIKILPYIQPIIFSPFLIVYAYYQINVKKKIWYATWGILGSILIVIFNASGKGIINILLVPLLMLLISFKRKRINNIVILILSITVIILPVAGIIRDLLQKNLLFASKYSQVISLFNIKQFDLSLNNIPTSPRYRIGEFINITYEYIQHPLFLIFGKGYGGAFKDYFNYFNINDLASFSEMEYISGLFFNPHEAVNVIFLKHGIFGLFFISLIIIKTIRDIHNSWFLIIGLYWLVILYGFSNILSMFGIICYVIGNYDAYVKKLQIISRKEIESIEK